ncbi:hypothetical protein P4S81_15585 [Pseudoalteromonas sp. B28]
MTFALGKDAVTSTATIVGCSLSLKINGKVSQYFLHLPKLDDSSRRMKDLQFPALVSVPLFSITCELL